MAGEGLGLPLWLALPVVLVGWWWPTATSDRPRAQFVFAVVVACGLTHGHLSGPGDGCLLPDESVDVRVSGRLLVSPRHGRAPFEPIGSCGVITAVVRGAAQQAAVTIGAGRPVAVEGRWRESRFGGWLEVTAVSELEEGLSSGWSARLRWAVVGWRDRLVDASDRLYGPTAPLVDALVLARREGLDPDVRATFAVAGIAHLLAISGFHVGVFCGVLLGLLRGVGLSRNPARLLAAAGAWLYVAGIGFPDAACRAALIVSCTAAAATRGTPGSRWAGLALAALVLLWLDPTRLAAPGFQLSFAGAAGLVGGARRATDTCRRMLQRVSGRDELNAVAGAVGAGVAATVATLPIAAWHFGRVSLVGIPLTLVATPLVSAALPGAIASLLLEPIFAPLARVLSGGVIGLLGILTAAAAWAAALPGAFVWVGRSTLIAAGIGGAVAVLAARRRGWRAAARRRATGMVVSAAVLLWPVGVSWQSRQSLEFWMVDVGQGDAFVFRTPEDRWVVIDAGPPPRGAFSRSPLVAALRERGVRSVDLLVLTHPDADHIGGAVGLLRAVDVQLIVDPGLAVAKEAYAELLREASDQDIPWSRARAGQRYRIDDLVLEVLAPTDSTVDVERAGAVAANAVSVVAVATWRDFRVLLTGDADVEAEAVLARALPDVDVLKVGHHGSTTSTSPLLLERSRPEVALISVGRGNRYGHPAPEVLERLESAGIGVLRSDRDGLVRVIVRRDGRYSVVTSTP